MSKKQRRTFSAEFKLETVLEVLRGEKPITQICRERDLAESVVHKWRGEFIERAGEIFADKRSPSSTMIEESSARIAQLEQMVGRLTMENEVLKNGVNYLARRKTNGR
jgi:transposase-like protein